MSTVIHAAGRALVPAADFLSPYDFFRDLTNPALAFLPRALLIAVVAALVCGSVGVHVVLRGMAFIGDAVAHSVFPGLAIAFVCGGSLVLGGALAGVVTAVLVALLHRIGGSGGLRYRRALRGRVCAGCRDHRAGAWVRGEPAGLPVWVDHRYSGVGCARGAGWRVVCAAHAVPGAPAHRGRDPGPRECPCGGRARAAG